jgi:hypothetical protein
VTDPGAVRGGAGLHAADPDDVADTLQGVAGCGLYFAVSTGAVHEPGWRPVRALYENPVVLARLVERVRIRLGTGQARVAASILFQGHAARLWSVSLGAVLRGGLLPDLDPDALLWRDQDGSVRLHLDRTKGWRGADLENALGCSVLDEHLTPLLAAVHRLAPLSGRLLWGNAASALLGAARVLDDAPVGPARGVAERLLNHGPLRGTLEVQPEGGYRRRSCCLFYRVPGGGLCGDCALTHSPAPGQIP